MRSALWNVVHLMWIIGFVNDKMRVLLNSVSGFSMVLVICCATLGI